MVTNPKQYQRDYMRQYRKRKRDKALASGIATDKPSQLDIDAGLTWIIDTLRVPTGLLAGQPFELYGWQADWIRGAYADGIREAGLSVARKNGKSGLIAALLLCHLVGVWNRPQWRGAVTSLTGNLAKELRFAIEQTALASGLDVTVKQSPTPGVIYGKRGAKLDFIAADKASGHSLSLDCAVIDESGLLPENKRSLVNAMFSSISARNGRMFSISIQGDSPMFKELEARSASDTVHWKRFAAASDCDLLDETAWHSANPGLGTIKSLDYQRDAAARAMSNPSDASYFRAYDLNQNLDPARLMICGVNDWTALYDDDCELSNETVVCGIDLGHNASMSSVAAIGLDSGIMRAWGAFGDTPGLLDRGRNDGLDNRYVLMRDRGELRTYPGRIVAPAQFLHDVFSELAASGCRIQAIGADRYRQVEATQALGEAGIRARFYPRGQGASATADGSADVRAFQRLVIERRIRCKPSLLMESAIGNSTLRFDGAGNPALDKSHARGRIDALSAAVIACGLYERRPAKRTVRLTRQRLLDEQAAR